MRLTDRQSKEGWKIRKDIGYSQKLLGSEELTYQLDGPDASGYDEWYTFTTFKDLGTRLQGNVFLKEYAPGPHRVSSFAHYADFELSDPRNAAPEILELFWKQIDAIDPESYIADADRGLNFATQNESLFDSVVAAVSAMKAKVDSADAEPED